MALDESSPVFQPEAAFRALNATRKLRFAVLRPPYPALGLGKLRVLRVRERADVTEIVAGYDGYERLPAEAAR